MISNYVADKKLAFCNANHYRNTWGHVGSRINMPTASMNANDLRIVSSISFPRKDLNGQRLRRDTASSGTVVVTRRHVSTFPFCGRYRLLELEPSYIAGLVGMGCVLSSEERQSQSPRTLAKWANYTVTNNSASCRIQATMIQPDEFSSARLKTDLLN